MYTVRAAWDGDAEVWIATSPEVPGLILESETLDGITEEARLALPELIDVANPGPISCTFLSERKVEFA